MTCDHTERGEPVNYCNINHDGDKHRTCAACNGFCVHDCNDCPHIFAVQVCDCGKQFVGELGRRYKADELVEHKD